MPSSASLTDPYPYFRGIVSELGFNYATVPYTQPKRAGGVTKNNFYTLFDLGIAGIVNHSKIPLRLATMVGFCGGVLCLLGALVYLVVKLLFWYNLPVGIAPLIITLFFLSSVQLFFLGILGEYVGAIYTQVRNRPLVVERERINFDDDEPDGDAARHEPPARRDSRDVAALLAVSGHRRLEHRVRLRRVRPARRLAGAPRALSAHRHRGQRAGHHQRLHRPQGLRLQDEGTTTCASMAGTT